MAEWTLRPRFGELGQQYRDAGWWNDATLGSMVADGLGQRGDDPVPRALEGAAVVGHHRRRRRRRSCRSPPRWPPTASGPATSWSSSCPTGWRPASRSGRRPTSVRWWCRSCTSTAPRRSTTSSTPPTPTSSSPPTASGTSSTSPSTTACWPIVPARAGSWSATRPPRRCPPRRDRVRGAARRRADRRAASPSIPTRRRSSRSRRARPRDPKGVIHSHRTIGCETRQLDHMFPKGGPPTITGAPVGHFIGMLNAFLVPLLRDRPVNLVDVWDPGEVLRLMLARATSAWAAARPSSSPASSTTPTSPTSTSPCMPFAGLGGSPVPAAVTRAGDRARHQGLPLLRQHRAPVDHRVAASTSPRRSGCTTDGHALPGVEIRLDERRRDLQPRARLLRRLHRPRADGHGVRRRRLVPHRRRRRARRRRLPHDHRPHVRHHHPRRREHQRPGGRGAAAGPGRRGRGRAWWPRPTSGSGEHAAAIVRLREGAALRPSRRCAPTWRRPGLARRSGRSRSTPWPATSPGRRRARSRSSASASSLRDGEPWK